MKNSRLTSLFKQKEQGLLNVYFTAGYPRLEDTEEIVLSLEAAGADLVEIGMPYSDPLADGPTIQQSGQVALENGMTVNVLFNQLEQIRPKTEIPIVLMGYFNQVMQYGEEAFLKKCSEVGVDGLILPDMPLDVFEANCLYPSTLLFTLDADRAAVSHRIISYVEDLEQ